jgi:hypothetical protein
MQWLVSTGWMSSAKDTGPLSPPPSGGAVDEQPNPSGANAATVNTPLTK